VSERLLEEVFLGVKSDFKEAGAVVIRVGRDVVWERPGYDPFPRRDLGLDTIFLSRPAIERVSRARLEKEPNVEIRSRARVIELIPSLNREAVAEVSYEGDSGTAHGVVISLLMPRDAGSRLSLSSIASDRQTSGTYLQATAGSQRHFSLAKVLLSAQPQL
jgi:hypothetical protein